MKTHLKFCALWSTVALMLCCDVSLVVAANVSVSLGIGFVSPQVIAINAGDTVTWQASSNVPNFTESFGGEWKSPSLTNGTVAFSYTFTNAGFFVYRTASVPGTVTVLPWTNSPPAITIVSPPDGFILPAGPVQPMPIFVEVEGAKTNIATVSFFVDDTLIDVVTNPPFTGKWVMLSAGGTHTLLAVASYKGTTSDDISRPVTVSFGGASVFSPRKLPGGEFMFYYSVSGPAGQAVPSIYSADDLLTLLSSRDGFVVSGSGVYIDFGATNSLQRFYSIQARPIP